MDSFRVLDASKQFVRGYPSRQYEALESQTLRMEAFLVKQHCSSLLEATQAAVSLVNHYLAADSSSLLALKVEENSKTGEFSLVLLIQRGELRSPYDFLSSARTTFQASTAGEKLLLISETRYARLYGTKDSAIKNYKWFDCESVNRALTEAVTLLGQRGKEGRLLQEINLNTWRTECSIQLLLRMKGTTLRGDIKQRRKRMNHYSEELLVRYVACLAKLLHCVHLRVIARQGCGHGSLSPACILIESEGVGGVEGFGGSLLCRLPLDLPSSVYASDEWRSAQQGEIQAADVFALGMVLLHMAQLWLPLDFYTSGKPLSESIACSLARLSSYSQGFRDLVGAMLAIRPQDRLSMQSVLERAVQHRVFEVPRVIPPKQNLNVAVQLAASQRNARPIEARVVNALEVIPAYAEQFNLCCTRGEYDNAEKLADTTIVKHRLDPFPLCQTFISIAMAHGLNRFAKSLISKALSVLRVCPAALSSQYAYCYQQLTTISTRMGILQDTERYVSQWLKLDGSSERPELLEMLTTGANAAFLADRKTQCVMLGTRALDLLGRQAEPKLLLQLLTLLINAAHHTKMSEKRQDNYLRLLDLAETSGAGLYVRVLKMREELYFDFALSETHLSEPAWISLQGVAALGTELGDSPQQVASILRRFVRSFEEVEGEQGPSTLAALQTAEHMAESLNLPLLATELQCTRELYEGRAVNLQERAENWVAQGELVLAEEACFAMETANPFQSFLDGLRTGLIVAQISPKDVANFLTLASREAFSALSNIPACKFPPQSKNVPKLSLTLSLHRTSAEWSVKCTNRADEQFRYSLGAAAKKNPFPVEILAKSFETEQKSEFDHYLNQLKSTYRYFARALTLQSQFYANTRNLQGAQNAGHRAAIAFAGLTQISSLRPCLIVMKTLLTVSNWPELKINVQEVEAGEELWSKLVLPLLGEARDPVPLAVNWSSKQVS